MASPFSIFRKNQKVAMAALTIMCMIAFSIGGVMSYSDMFGGGSGVNDVARTRYRTYTRDDLDRMVRSRQLATNFISYARLMAARDPSLNLGPDFPLRVLSSQPRFAAPFGSLDPESVIRDRVLADQAKRMGLVVSDQAVLDYINSAVREFVDIFRQFNPSLSGQLTDADYANILNDLATGRNDRVEFWQVVEAIRSEMLVGRLYEMYGSGFQITPAQRWEYFLKLNRKVKAEVLPIKAEEMVAQVANPSESELHEFFDKHKNQEARPGSPIPGFKVPAKAAVEYFAADYERFYAQAEATITQQDIEKDYEQNKETQYRWQSFGHGSDSDDLPLDEKPKTETPKDEAPKKDAPDKSEEPAKPDAKKPEDKDSPDKSKVESKPEDKKPDATEPKKPADDSDSKKSSRLHRMLPALALAGSKAWISGIHELSLFSTLFSGDEDEAKKAAEPKEGDNKAKAPAEKNPGDAKSPEKEPAATNDDNSKKPATSEPAKTTSGTVFPGNLLQSAEPSSGKVPVSPPPIITEEDLLPLSIKDGPNPPHSPLWKVEKDIRKKLTEQRVTERIKKAFEDIREQLDTYFVDRTSWEADVKTQPNLKEPKPVDFGALAKKHELTLHKTEPISALQFSKMPDLGEAMMGRDRLVAVVFGGLGLYQARESQDIKGNRYLVWKFKDEKSYVPTLDDSAIRDEVVRTWKMMKGRDLARTEAEKLAKQANTAKQSLTDLFGNQPGKKVSETNEFSWMTTGTAGGMQFNRSMQPTLSEVEGVDEPGNGFMQEISKLEVGDAGVALNQPETIAYVIRVTRVDPDLSILHDRFMQTGIGAYQAEAEQARRQQQAAWVHHILQEAGFEFLGRLAGDNDGRDADM